MKKFIDNLSNENNFSIYSSFFRIFICIHLLKKILFTWQHKGLLFMDKSFYVSEKVGLISFFNIDTNFIHSNFQIFYFLYLLLIILFFFGIGKNFTAILLFIFYEFLQNLCPIILNGGDNLLKFILLYMIFINSYDYLAIKTKKTKNNELLLFNNFISNIGGYAICIHLCFVYFFSAIHKVHSELWFNGIATYYTLSLERFRGTPINLELAKNYLFVNLSTYGTILIELFYPCLIWFKRTKYIMIFLAIVLHSSIYIFMMIYDFQMVFIFVQGFFISNSTYRKIFYNLKNNQVIRKIQNRFKVKF